LNVEQRIKNIEEGLLEVVVDQAGFTDFKSLTQIPRKASLLDRMAYYKTPGASIAVINDNRIEWAKAYGVLKAGADAPVTTESVFEAASISKLIVAALALHYIESEALSLDEDVNRYLKSWRVPENEFTREKKVTLRLLLSHQSGLPLLNTMWYDEKVGVPTLVQVLKGEAPAWNKPAIPEHVPGNVWRYSNIGYVLIQLLLEDALGRPFVEIAEETIFKPTGMKSSTFMYPLSAEQRQREAMPHNKNGELCEPAMHGSALAQGGLITTPTDLAKFTLELMQAYQGKSRGIFSQGMARQLFNSEREIDFYGLPMAMGLGAFLRGKDHFTFSHTGYNYPGSGSWLEACPNEGKGVTVMVNGENAVLLELEILAAVFKEYEWETDPYLRLSR
jgi:CubicO group peptidase (beta-lactamase class C family)